MEIAWVKSFTVNLFPSLCDYYDPAVIFKAMMMGRTTLSVCWLDTSHRSVYGRAAARIRGCIFPRRQTGWNAAVRVYCNSWHSARTAAAHSVPVAQKEINVKWRKQIIGVSGGWNSPDASQSELIYLFAQIFVFFFFPAHTEQTSPGSTCGERGGAAWLMRPCSPAGVQNSQKSFRQLHVLKT